MPPVWTSVELNHGTEDTEEHGEERKINFRAKRVVSQFPKLGRLTPLSRGIVAAGISVGQHAGSRTAP